MNLGRGTDLFATVTFHESARWLMPSGAWNRMFAAFNYADELVTCRIESLDGLARFPFEEPVRVHIQTIATLDPYYQIVPGTRFALNFASTQLGTGVVNEVQLPPLVEAVDEAPIPEGMAGTYAMLKRAYPDGIPDRDYFCVLALLGPHMSNRQLALIVSLFTHYSRAGVENDSAAVESTSRPIQREIDRVQRHLDEAGFAEWREADD